MEVFEVNLITGRKLYSKDFFFVSHLKTIWGKKGLEIEIITAMLDPNSDKILENRIDKDNNIPKFIRENGELDFFRSIGKFVKIYPNKLSTLDEEDFDLYFVYQYERIKGVTSFVDSMSRF